MSELTLDFTDASFDADPAEHYIIDPSDNLVFEMMADGTADVTSPLLDRGTGENVADDEFTGARAISSMAISSAPGTTFAFEFIDNPDDEGSASKEGKRSLGDQYATSGNVDGNDITLFMNEAMFQPGIDVTNGDTFKIEVTEVTAGTPGTPATVTPVSVTGPNPDPLAPDMPVGTLGNNAGTWVLDYNVGPMSQQFSGDWAAVSAKISDLGGTQVGGQDLGDVIAADLLDSMTSPGSEGTPGTELTYDFYIGDGEGETWVVSGDLNGRDPSEWDGGDTATNDIIGFRPGTYDGVFLGGDGFDTLRFDHNSSAGDLASGPTKMFVDLSSGIAMFGNGQASPLVQFADVGGDSYALDWERLDLVGESNDTVIVGGG